MPKVALEGRGRARYSAKRHSLFGECEIRWYHAGCCVLWGEAACFFTPSVCLFPPQAAADSLSLKEGGFILLPLLLIPKASLPEGDAERSEAEGVILPAPAAPRRPSSIRKAQSPKCSPAPPPHAAQCTGRAARRSPKQRSRVWRCQSSAAPARWRAWA